MLKRHWVLIGIIALAAFLRLWKLDQVPVSLFGDELDVGYQAYSILKTGRDYQGNLLPLHFHSLAEWRTPLYLYSTVPTVALFGISALGVRLPAALFGIAGVAVFYYLVKYIAQKYKMPVDAKSLGLVAAFLMAISPWHIQYSRAGFEVTQMLFFLMAGLYLFFKSLDTNGKHLWLAVGCFLLMPWGYSTAKLFTPLLFLMLLGIYGKKILHFEKKELVASIIVGLLLGLPLVYTVLNGGAVQRFSYIGIFSDPTIESHIGSAREQQARFRGEMTAGLQPTVVDRLYHNKLTLLGDKFSDNYMQAFSTDFLFIKGDINLRHSIEGQGMLYKQEALLLLIGIIMFFGVKSWKVKAFVAMWILLGVVPSAVTQDGGTHATRLILIMPPLLFLVACGIVQLIHISPKRFVSMTTMVLTGLYLVSFAVYQHNYWTINPWYSERWWHAGWGEAVQYIKVHDQDYDRVLITTADEPPWIFFAGWYAYPPADWQKEFPLGNDVELEGIGKVSHIDKFYFGSPEGGLYDWGKVLTADDLYLASAKEVNVNLIREPERSPEDLVLLESVAYPSGEPAFYIFTGTNVKE